MPTCPRLACYAGPGGHKPDLCRPEAHRGTAGGSSRTALAPCHRVLSPLVAWPKQRPPLPRARGDHPEVRWLARALVRAGLPSNARHGPHAAYDYATVVQAIAAAWRELRRYPSVARYDAWCAGRSEFPAAATARGFARSWDDLEPMPTAGLCARRAPRARNDCLAQPLGSRGAPRFGADRPCSIGSGKGAADSSDS